VRPLRKLAATIDEQHVAAGRTPREMLDDLIATSHLRPAGL
jgi:hypothetical protein